jgi:dTDP-4-amino-4,6-dideoxy-D-galactose acyltransferase
MHHMIEKLDWDSAFFGFPIGQFAEHRFTDIQELDRELDHARQQGLRCLYFLADSTDPLTVSLSEQRGFTLVDVRMLLENVGVQKTSDTLPLEGWLVDDARSSDLPYLEEISNQLSRVSRFAFDPRFGEEKAAAMYRVWIRKSLNGYAEMIKVVRNAVDQRPVGLITCRSKGPCTSIQLIGIHDKYFGSGLGGLLVHSALNWARECGADLMSVVTQGRNTRAVRLYERHGFLLRSLMLYYHKWF